MSKELKTLKSCHILDRLREWFELYGNQNHQRAEEELHLAIDELYEYQQKDQKISDLEAKLAESEEKIEYTDTINFVETSEPDIVAKELDRLNQQLADKTLTIEQINKAFIENRSLWKGKYEQAIQDKISFAVEQLEKVKEKFISENWDLYDTSDLLEQVCELRNNQIKFLDNQIKQLKEEEDK